MAEAKVDDTYVWRQNPAKCRQNSFLLPKDIRGLIVSRSNSGKTVTLFHLSIADNRSLRLRCFVRLRTLFASKGTRDNAKRIPKRDV